MLGIEFMTRLARSFIESRRDVVSYHKIDIASSGLRFQIAIPTWSEHRNLSARDRSSAANYQSKTGSAPPVTGPMMYPRQLPKVPIYINCLWKDTVSAKYLLIVLEDGSVGRTIIKFE